MIIDVNGVKTVNTVFVL